MSHVTLTDRGLAPPVQPEQTTGTIPASDRPTGRGGSDRLRTYGALYALTIILIVLGLMWFAGALFLRTQTSTGD